MQVIHGITIQLMADSQTLNVYARIRIAGNRQYIAWGVTKYREALRYCPLVATRDEGILESGLLTIKKLCFKLLTSARIALFSSFN
jgi:hypothetical protein